MKWSGDLLPEAKDDASPDENPARATIRIETAQGDTCFRSRKRDRYGTKRFKVPARRYVLSVAQARPLPYGEKRLRSDATSRTTKLTIHEMIVTTSAPQKAAQNPGTCQPGNIFKTT